MSLCKSVVLLTCFAYCVNSLGDFTVIEAIKYLQTYGYMRENEGLRSLSRAIEKFQDFFGLEISGILDPQTQEAMMKPRCGIIDLQDKTYLKANEFELFRSKWEKNELAYKITNYQKSLDKNAVDEDIRHALNIWEKYTNMKFTPVNKDADILISFETGDHGDDMPFKTDDHVLAHSFPPRRHIGDVHFRDDADWVTGTNFDGTNLYNVAAHQFGHSLGIDHSSVPNSIMFPTYHSTNFRDNLHSDDIMAIQNLYGAKENSPSDNSLCEVNKVDTIFRTGSGNNIVFKGNKYWRLPRKIFPNYPRNISDTFPALPQAIDVAFSFVKDIYFLKNDKVWKYRGFNLYKGYPKSISKEFPGIPNDIDTAFMWEKSRKLFFFKGNEVWGFEFNKFPHVDSKYPVNIEGWGIPTPYDGTLVFRGKIYIFKDTQYYKLNLKNNTAEQGYPRTALDDWFGC